MSVKPGLAQFDPENPGHEQHNWRTYCKLGENQLMIDKMASKSHKKVVTGQHRLKMRALHCLLFSVSISVDKKDFQTAAFLGSLPPEFAENIDESDHFSTICYRKTKQIDYAAALRIGNLQSDSSKNVVISIILHPSNKVSDPDEVPPFAENVFDWLRQRLLENASLKIIETCEFRFAPTYQSVFFLPLKISGPLNNTAHPIFENSQIVGVRIRPSPNELALSSIIQDAGLSKGIGTILMRDFTTTPVKLLTLEQDVAVLYNIAMSAVRPGRQRK